MNAQNLRVEFEPAEGALPRLLGLIERRGYQILDLGLCDGPGAQSYLDIRLIPRNPEHDLGILRRQITRLIEVARVEENPQKEHMRALA